MVGRGIRGMAWGVAALAACATLARGECGGRWILGPEQGVPGVHGSVNAMVVFDPDGPGPQPELLVLAGGIDAAGTRRAGGVAAWDGAEWRSIGPASEYIFASSLTVYQGELIAGNVLEGSTGVGRWDGAAWQPVGGGLGTSVNALATHNGELIAATNASLGSGPPGSVMAWNGAAWRPIGSEDTLEASSLLSLDGWLYASGRRGVHRWDGASWHAVFFGDATMTVHEGALHVGTDTSGDWFGRVWRLDPGGAVELVGMTGDIFGLGSAQGELWACGALYLQGAASPVSVARWDGQAWHAAGTFDGDVRLVTVFGGSAIVAGPFFSENGAGMEHVARRHGEGWTPLGAGICGAGAGGNPSAVVAAAADDSRLVLAGAVSGPAGAEDSRAVACWDGASLAGVNGGVSGGVAGQYDWPQCAVAYGGGVVVGGYFTKAGDLPVNYIARWDGAAWHALGAGLDGPPTALAIYRGDLICGGEFTTAGGVPAYGLARWDGAAWSRFGDLHAAQGYVSVLLVDGDSLYVAGGLQVTEGNTWRLARWDGALWTHIAGEVFSPILALARFHGDLIVGGGILVFTPEGQQVTGLARWDGAGWHALENRGAGAGCFPLQVHGDSLFVGGSTAAVIGGERHSVARWDGAAWHALDGVVLGLALAMSHSHGELLVGGDVFSFPDADRASARWRLSETGIPWVARQPMAQGVGAGGDAVFHIAPASGYDFDGPLTFEWRRNGAPVADGPGGAAAGGGAVSGAGTPDLMIAGVQLSDAGAYTCVVANGCGGAASDAAGLFVTGGCAGDANGDGLIDFLDLNIVLSFYGQNSPALPGDLDGDGDVDFVDLNIVLSFFGTGC